MPMVNQEIKGKALKMIADGRITVGEAARLVGVTTAAVSQWVTAEGLDWRGARWRAVEREWAAIA